MFVGQPSLTIRPSTSADADWIRRKSGIGTALLNAVREVAENAGCNRLWLLTTNDNLPALGFYQKRGFSLVRVHVGAAESARRLKPTIPLIGIQGIPMKDDIELEMLLEP